MSLLIYIDRFLNNIYFKINIVKYQKATVTKDKDSVVLYYVCASSSIVCLTPVN